MNQRRWTHRLIAFALLGWLGTWVAIGEGSPTDLAPPSAAQQAQAEQTIRDLLDVEFQTNDPSQLRALGRQLLRLGVETVDDPVHRFVLLRLARDLATQAGDVRLAFEAVDEIAQTYDVDPLQMKLESLHAAASVIQDAPTNRALVQIALELLDDALAVDDYTVAQQILAFAYSSATQVGDKQLAQRIESRTQEMTGLQAQYELVKDAAVAILRDPDDPESNLAVGEYLCFTKDLWDRGLPRLAKGSDQVLGAVAVSDLAQPRGPGLQLRVAHGWRKVAQNQNPLRRWNTLRRADRWYRLAYPKLTGLTQLKVRKRMLSQPLLAFDAQNPPTTDWIEEHFIFSANYGRTGPGSWANYSWTEETSLLVANRAGYVQTEQEFPPASVDRYRIDAIIASDLLVGTALQFAGETMYFGSAGGIHLHSGWKPSIIHPIEKNKYHHYEIDVEPDRISFTVDGIHVGTMAIDHLDRGPIVLRGWEGHVQCKRLVVWTIPDRGEVVDIAATQESNRGD